ncbi:heterokaryon incompatibility protein-domain-containing protein [Paraphoma chrysanthemicola]|uniref:Heterokaryon incompatibility protein-domain-containing protein n=1 Tax=Paraphoma chrysanthemicola TaxID=798071 RepID=A0A8K0R3R3_9PLEO|nr:heterokaryon incompatibility protein-domain-containing protein [Paraphoma chrysanthemicola]
MSVFAEVKKRNFEAWVPVLKALANPARHPQFQELTSHGEWNDWSPNPELPDEEPTLVEQPSWTQVYRPIDDPNSQYSHELEIYPGGLHHEPLEDKTIRLLDIRNARFRGNVLEGFRLVTVPLADAPSFDALSYCWGDMRLCTGIIFDTGEDMDLVERMFRVTEDLATCLHSILMTRKLKEKPSYLWIDQICINQEDITERNRQVPLMTEIYQTARQVLVWLGQKSHVTVENAALPEEPAADTDVNGQCLLDWVFEKSIFARPWFFRLWTFQEVVLANQIQVLVGEDCQPWESLTEQSEAIDHPIHGTRSVIEMNSLTRNLNWLIVGTICRCRHLMNQAGMVELQTWLPVIVVSQHCRNPRDKIYGLIGLEYGHPGRQLRRDHLPAQRSGLGYIKHRDPEDALSPGKQRPDVSFITLDLPANFVDYRKPIETVFRDFARLMVESRRSLKFLTLYDHDTTVWFPQFRSSILETSPGLMVHVINRGQYAASAERIHVHLPPTDDRCLDVKGRTVAEVVVDIAEMPSDIKQFYFRPAEVLDIRALCHRCWTHVAPVYSKSAEDEWVAAFIKDMVDTIFCHESGFEQTAPVSLEGRSIAEVYTMIYALLGLIDQLGPETMVGPTMNDHEEQALRVELSRKALHFIGRRLVVLDTGHLALVQKGVREGDKVAILHGLDVPCILRRVEDSNMWRWLGDAFVLGLMRGEGVLWEENDADIFSLV